MRWTVIRDILRSDDPFDVRHEVLTSYGLDHVTWGDDLAAAFWFDDVKAAQAAAVALAPPVGAPRGSAAGTSIENEKYAAIVMNGGKA